jgi:phosphoribosyl 1,2-cyclic phosphodiesterase
VLSFKSLGSGSSGNATLVEASGLVPTRLLVDCGLGIRQLAERLARCNLAISDIDAIFITHEHSDHIGCALALSIRHKIPVWMSRGTYQAINEPDFEGRLHLARDGSDIAIGGLQLTPFTVPHDAREPLQLTCTDGAAKLGILTDLGHATPYVLTRLKGCDGLLLEANHDADMLAVSSYPEFLKRRVGGLYGHLSNHTAIEILGHLIHSKLKHVVAAHLSAQNNTPTTVQLAFGQALNCSSDEVVIASASHGTEWLQL